MKRLFLKVTRELLPQVRDKYPFIYLEHGRLEIDDSSVKWINSDCHVVPLPVAMINTLLLGPGTSVTHAAIKSIAETNCTICWVGEDSLLYYATGETPTYSTYNMKKQIALATNGRHKLEVARAMFKMRFPTEDLSDKSLHELMGMEGFRVKALYKEKADTYGVDWKGREYIPGKFELSNISNIILTSCNAALYGIILSVVHSLGFSPRVGFIHSGSPLPFVYDIADLYKAEVSIDLAFKLPKEMYGEYQSKYVAEKFREKILELKILERSVNDICSLMGIKK